MAPPKITNTTREISLKPGPRTFVPVALTQLNQPTQDQYQPGTNSSLWNPRSRGLTARPASPGWLETATEMEGYVRCGQSAQDIVDFGIGELEGGRDALTATLKGTAQLVRHPWDSVSKVSDAVWASGPALSEFSKHSDEIVRAAAEKKCRQFLEADNRQRGRMLGNGLTQVGLAVAPYPKLSTLVQDASKLVARTLPKAALAESIPSLPILAKLRRPLETQPPSTIPTPPPVRENTGFLGKKGWEMRNAGGPHPPQNSPRQINGMHYTGHSLDQMRNRGIMPSVIENAIIHGEASAGRDGCRVFCDMDNKLRVVLDNSLSSVVTTLRGVR